MSSLETKQGLISANTHGGKAGENSFLDKMSSRRDSKDVIFGDADPVKWGYGLYA